MAKLIYSMPQSLDGCVEDEVGDFGWGAPFEDFAELRSYRVASRGVHAAVLEGVSKPGVAGFAVRWTGTGLWP